MTSLHRMHFTAQRPEVVDGANAHVHYVLLANMGQHHKMDTALRFFTRCAIDHAVMLLNPTFWQDFGQNSFSDCVASKLQHLDSSRDSNINFCVMILVMNCSLFSRFVHESMRLFYLVFFYTSPLGRKNSSWFA